MADVTIAWCSLKEEPFLVAPMVIKAYGRRQKNFVAFAALSFSFNIIFLLGYLLYFQFEAGMREVRTEIGDIQPVWPKKIAFLSFAAKQKTHKKEDDWQ